jgi:predicted amidohydrolase
VKRSKTWIVIEATPLLDSMLKANSQTRGESKPKTVGLVLGQVPIGWDIQANLVTLESVLDQARPQDLVVLPEGMISGYDDELSGLKSLQPEDVAAATVDVSRFVQKRNLHLLCGTLMFQDTAWSNVVIYFSPEGARHVYRKVNLATHERSSLAAGSQLSIFDLEISGSRMAVSPQVCRELRFPDQWHYPARKGAQIFAYLSCAANVRESREVWRSALITRAAETQRFVAAVNVARRDGNSPTMVVSPRGEIIAEAIDVKERVIRVEIDLSLTSDWYISQQRSDVIEIKASFGQKPRRRLARRFR